MNGPRRQRAVCRSRCCRAIDTASIPLCSSRAATLTYARMGSAMAKTKCPTCDSTKGVKHMCQACNKKHCRECCKRYVALQSAPKEQVRCCNECFLKNVAWDSSRTYDVLGPADGKPVVLVHGALVGRQCLVLEARALADAGYRVILPDLPAHGARFEQVPLTLDNAVSTLREVISKEAPDVKVVVMGFSMGGYVAAAFAASHPELTAGVVLGACAHDAHTTTWKLVGKMAELVYKVCSYKTKSGFIYNSYPDIMSKDRPEIQECFLRAGAEFDSWKYTWRVMYDANMYELLPRIMCPALIVVGEKDFRSHEKVWLSLLRKGRLLVLKGGLHQFMLQPGIVDEYRKEAAEFAAAAEWGKAGEVPAAPAAVGAEAVKAESAEGGLLTTGVARTPGPGAAPTSGGVGLGEVFRNLWRQRGSRKEE